MRILFVGDASATHYNLTVGLRELGNQTTLISGQAGWRCMPQDVRLERNPGRFGAVKYLAQLIRLLPSMKGFDVVQLVGPHFLELKSERLLWIYDYLRKNNGKIIMDAIGDDYYFMKGSCDKRLFRYGDFNLGETDRRPTFQWARQNYADWTAAAPRLLNEHMAETADAIIPYLYEYWACYQDEWKAKSHYLPLPVLLPKEKPTEFNVGHKVKIFIGIQRERNEFKGTDIMLDAAQNLVKDFPDIAELLTVENVPYDEYKRLMEGSDVILDQLYSYTPAQNALIAMSKGIINVGGGEPEMYDLLGEDELRPILNVQPSYESVYETLKDLVLHKERIPGLKRQSVEFIWKHHHYLKVAEQHVKLYNLL